MIVHTTRLEPVQDENGEWSLKEEEFDEDIPDLGRGSLFCNSCSSKQYPDCKQICNCWKHARITENGEIVQES